VKATRSAAGLLVAAFVAIASQQQMDARMGLFPVQHEALYLWSGDYVRRMVPGFETLVADLYWLRTVQYFGGQRLFAKDRRFELLFPLVDITTTLDPRLEVAYRYGAIFLCEPAPIGAGRCQDGVKILEKGIKNNPLAWRLRQDLGFYYYIFLKDPQKASDTLLDAARVPGAAFWLRAMAADIWVRAGDRRTSRQMWQHLLEQADEGIIKENARFRLRLLDTLDLAAAIEEVVRRFERTEGRRPQDLTELRRAGAWRGPLEDGSGKAFSYDASSGRVRVARDSPLWRDGF
jgi:hypothetical protein